MKSNISAREQQVLQLIAYEHNSKEIAQQLYISEHTVMSHRKNLNSKLDVRNSAGLVRRAFEMGILKIGVVLFLALVFCPILTAQDIIYVDHQATSTEDGTTWARAYRTLNLALDLATPGDSILISEGTYMPPDTGRLSSFIMKDGLTIVGGFDPHNGISEIEDISSYFFNQVILSGDIGIPNDSSDNSYHVLIDQFPGALSTGCRLVGLHITEGNATTIFNKIGGGILVRGGRLDIIDCSIYNNAASFGGAALSADSTILNIQSSSIRDNNSELSNQCYGTLNVTDCILTCNGTSFSRNECEYGGAIYSLNSDISLLDNDFSDNIASGNGGAVWIDANTKGFINQSRFFDNNAAIGGGIYLSSDSLTTIANSIVTLNSASNRGGGLYLTSGAKVEIINSNINFNTSDLDQGAGIYNSQSDCTILNSIICHNNPDIALGVTQNYNSFSPTNSQMGHCYVEYSGGSSSWSVTNTTDLGGNIDIDPMFDWIDVGDSLRQEIDCWSPLINKGHNAYNMLPEDLDFETRVIRDTIDIGAQEFQDDVDELTWTGGGDGINWHDPSNWSCLRIPTQSDDVILESAGDTIVIDTGVGAVAFEVKISNHCALLVKEDAMNQHHGSLITNQISLSIQTEQRRNLNKSTSTRDSAYFLNQGIVTILNDGLICSGYCHITNENELELNQNGINLNPDNCFDNKGVLRINIENDEAIDIGLESGGSFTTVHPFLTNINRKDFKSSLSSTLHNWPGAEINITGSVMGPNDQSFDEGIEVATGSVLNEGTINMRNLKNGLLLGYDDLDGERYRFKNVMIFAGFRNDGVINIIETTKGIVGFEFARFTNNEETNGSDLWTCPLEFNVGFEFFNFGELDLRN